jgi:hypothetical protein
MFEPLDLECDQQDLGPDGYADGCIDVLSRNDEWEVSQALDAVETLQWTDSADDRAAASALCAVEDLQRLGEVDTLDPEQVLVRAGAGQRQVNLASAEQLGLAARWADLHAEFCRVELGCRLGLSQVAAGFLIGDALDLRHRLPLVWQQVQGGEVKVSVARKVASMTRRLSLEAAARVDRKVAGIAATVPSGRIVKVVEAAILRGVSDGLCK